MNRINRTFDTHRTLARLRWLGLVLLAGLPLKFVAASERSVLRVEAPIVAVEPVVQKAPALCDIPTPAHAEGLVAALRWDLYGRCRENPAASEVTGYRVDYEWDGQRFSTLLTSKPTGDTLPLRLDIQ